MLCCVRILVIKLKLCSMSRFLDNSQQIYHIYAYIHICKSGHIQIISVLLIPAALNQPLPLFRTLGGFQCTLLFQMKARAYFEFLRDC